jgi:hypothetical protein
LLRQQQLQRQQEQNSHYEQQHRVTVQQVSPSSTYQQEQHRSTAGFGGGQQPSQGRARSASERQRQDEQGFLSLKCLTKSLNTNIYLDYYAGQRQMAAQRAHQLPPSEEPSHPVGIRVCTYINYHLIFHENLFLESYE